MSSIDTSFIALRIEGGLLPAEFVARVASLDAPGQRPEDYGIPPGRTLRDEIGRYWSIAEALWKEYREQSKRADLSANRIGIDRWLFRLLRDVLGYSDIATATARVMVGERGFPITHRAHEGALPLLLTTREHSLDRPDRLFGDESRRRAPHATVQEYLNADASVLWGVVSNGLRLRFLRDNPSLTRPAFIEADLERIFEEGLYADFAALWLLGHASRFSLDANGVAGHRMEAWRSEGAKTGQRALDRLRAGVTSALRDLGTGFVEHPANEALRTALRDGALSADDLHQQLLRLVYRFLLLFTAEERNLLHPPEATEEVRELYAQGYSLGRVRDRARFKRFYDQHADLWAGLTVTFQALAHGAPALGLPALGGLFGPGQCPDLDRGAISNSRLLSAIHSLSFFTSEGTLNRVNYRDMGTEELGSVYESLLELHPIVQVATRPWRFGFVGDETGSSAKGNERKLSGSYYTPDSLVQELLRSALDPVIQRTINNNPDDPKGALLQLKILDPACGSGHFLLGAARRLADAVARLDAESDLPDEALRRHALREVVRRCVYGVDRNPLSVELCKTALWIEAIEPGKPLSFLDAHIKCGDSLVGVFDLKVLKDGIPDEAFKDLTGDDKAYSRELRKRNKAERENPTLGLLPEVSMPTDLADVLTALAEAPEDTLEQVEAKRHKLHQLHERASTLNLRIACDLWCGAFFIPKAGRPERRGQDLVPTTDTVWRYLRAASTVYEPLLKVTEDIAERARYFHWPLEFPDAFAAGGFDCVLGNPPWEVLQLSEEEYFSARDPSIADLAGAARKRAIKSLEHDNPRLWKSYQSDLQAVEAGNQFVRQSGRFALTAVGKLNTYALFAEHFLKLIRPGGRSGLIVPTGIATDDSTKAFFDAVSAQRRLVSLYDFENREAIFPSVHRSYKFALLTLGSDILETQFTFFVTQVEQLSDTRRAFTLSPDDIRLINPNTRTCPVFRSSADAELTKKIYSRVPVLIDDSRGAVGNPWRITFRQGLFNMTSDSGLFRTAQQLMEAGAQREGANWLLSDGAVMVPLYEAKMIHHFDHRWATYEEDGSTSRDLTPSEKASQATVANPRYWVSEVEVDSRLRERGWSKGWLMGWRDICRSTDERTVIATAFPRCGVGHTLPIWFAPSHPAPLWAGLNGCLSSIVFDYNARQKVGGTHLTYGYLKQLAAIPPQMFSDSVLNLIKSRMLELTYTANDMRAWAEDLGYTGQPFVWDEDRRAHLRAELDAVYAYLYGLNRDELRYILDPADIYGPDFPSETFRVLKDKEIRQFSEYRTARLVLQAWDRFSADGTFASLGTGGMRTVA